MDILYQIIIYLVASFSMFGIIYGGYRNCQRLKTNQHKLAPQEENTNFLNFFNEENDFSLI
jgi:hypothetical protein